jgi:hypothetical protein
MSFTPPGLSRIHGMRRRLFNLLLAIAVVILFGTLGFYLIEGLVACQ